MIGHEANICRKPRKEVPDRGKQKEVSVTDLPVEVPATTPANIVETVPAVTVERVTDSQLTVVPPVPDNAKTVTVEKALPLKPVLNTKSPGASAKEASSSNSVWITVQRNSGKKNGSKTTLPPVSTTLSRGNRPPPKPKVDFPNVHLLVC